MSDNSNSALPRNAYEPAGMQWADDGATAVIQWADGHESRYSLQYLRRICPCATCRRSHETPPLSAKPKRFNVLTDGQALVVRNELSIESAFPIGNYAIGFRWNDGHDEGIYSYEYLRNMCPSESNANRLAPPSE